LQSSINQEFEGHGVFQGEVRSFMKKEGLYRVQYDDGDFEDLSEQELAPLVVERTNADEVKKHYKPTKQKPDGEPTLSSNKRGGDFDLTPSGESHPPSIRAVEPTVHEKMDVNTESNEVHERKFPNGTIILKVRHNLL
jgi:hypothetical protein